MQSRQGGPSPGQLPTAQWSATLPALQNVLSAARQHKQFAAMQIVYSALQSVYSAHQSDYQGSPYQAGSPTVAELPVASQMVTPSIWWSAPMRIVRTRVPRKPTVPASLLPSSVSTCIVGRILFTMCGHSLKLILPDRLLLSLFRIEKSRYIEDLIRGIFFRQRGL